MAISGVGGFGVGGGEIRLGPEARPSSSLRTPAAWRPRGLLLATLYEYAHSGGVPVVKVDTTDDSRLLVTGGRDGVVKIWNAPALERDVAVASSDTFTVAAPAGVRDGDGKQRLRALRTIRDSKGVAVGRESGDVLLYRIESARTGARATQVAHFDAGARNGACAVMCIEQFDTELESLVVFAQQHGHVRGWDVRSQAPSWTLARVPPWLGVPSCLAPGDDGRSLLVGTLGGGLLAYDLRFLVPWTSWKVASGAPINALRGAGLGSSSQPRAFAALGGDCNELALLDVATGSCAALFATEPVAAAEQRPRDLSASASAAQSVAVPTLLSVPLSASSGSGSGALQEQSWNSLLQPPRGSAGSVRALWLPRGSRNGLLAAGADRKVRYWSLDPERQASEAYVVTPPDALAPGPNAAYPSSSTASASPPRTSYTSSRIGDVPVVQEQFLPSPLRSSPRSANAGSRSGFGGDGSAAAGAGAAGAQHGTNPNHRDAILDMCAISLQHDILVTAGRDGLVKLWR
eukprot:TRINITY_DN16017_c0_g1_i1.p1 TRINITY_DN16017_c0_g1~~TRINITY_DN16017_c0_g1_i1.p1  ORF type:complete len:593 (+),score=134.25 TRINITY_DN16017_c0_g1_i1:228-1781(+)